MHYSAIITKLQLLPAPVSCFSSTQRPQSDWSGIRSSADRLVEQPQTRIASVCKRFGFGEKSAQCIFWRGSLGECAPNEHCPVGGGPVIGTIGEAVCPEKIARF